jgi:hypothetical protein
VADYLDDAKEMTTDIVSEFDELGKLFPYAKQIIAVYNFVRIKRMKWFLKALSSTQDKLTSKEKNRFEKLLESDEGQELLAEYADSVINTSSKTANIALAILFGDIKTESFEKTFKILAAPVLRGITENVVDLFLALIENKELLEISDIPPYPIWACREDFVSQVFDVDSEFRDASVLYSVFGELIRRGLLAPDHVLGWIADPGISIHFGITKTSMSFYHLLNRARNIAKQLQ